MTYNRMEAKPIAGEHCRFCGDASAALVKTPCCRSGFVAIRPFCRFEAVDVVRSSTNALVCATPTMRINMVVLGKPVSNAVISGHREITEPMRRIRSIGQNIEWWDVNEVQIPGTKIER